MGLSCELISLYQNKDINVVALRLDTLIMKE